MSHWCSDKHGGASLDHATRPHVPARLSGKRRSTLADADTDSHGPPSTAERQAVDIAHGPTETQDTFDESPNGYNRGQNEQGADGKDYLKNTDPDKAKVESMYAKHAK